MGFSRAKRLGQNFLVDRNIAREIVVLAEPSEEDVIIEIGPGQGALTGELARACRKLVCIEIDKGLSQRLGERFFAEPRVEVVTADALKVSFPEIAKGYGRPLKLVSNLPYHISGPMMAKLLEERRAFSVMVLMFQKEVAQRILAGPGSRDYSPLSILANVYTDASMERVVPPGAFRPVPKVESAVVRFRVLDRPRVEILDEQGFKRLLRAAFSARRKTIGNSLLSLGRPKEDILRALDKAGISPLCRAETVGAPDFARLLCALEGPRYAQSIPC